MSPGLFDELVAEFVKDADLSGADAIDQVAIPAEDATEFVLCLRGSPAEARLVGSTHAGEHPAGHVDEGHAHRHGFQRMIVEMAGLA